MRALNIGYFFSIIILLLSVNVSAEKYGLAVGISHFEPKSEIKPLHSPLNDVALVTQAWQAQGFKKNDIAVLVDSEATKEAVEQGLQHLIATCKAGDIVWLFFSTHGQKLQDFNGYSTDGYVNSLVMYDSPSKYEPGYHSQRHLTDEDIRVFAKKMRTKLGPRGELVLFIDACHSGLMMRGTSEIKNIPYALTEPGYNPSAKTENMATDGFYSSIIESKVQEAVLAPYVFYSACRSNEVCSEVFERSTRKVVGPLALACSQALTTAQPGETFRQLFAKIQTEMNVTVPNQTPVATGTGLDKVILGGNVKPLLYTYRIKNILSPDTVELYGGTFSGIYQNTEFAFYKVDDLNHRRTFKKGIVVSAEPFSVIVACEAGANTITKENARVLEAVITRKSFGDKTVSVAIDTAGDVTERKWLEGVINGCKVARLKSISDKPDLLVRRNASGRTELLYPDEALFVALNVRATADTLAEAISRFAKVQAIKGLQMDNPFIMAQIDMRAVAEKTISDTVSINYPTGGEAGVIVHAGKDLLNIKITNSGSKVFYVNIIDIGPDGEISPFWPGHEIDAAEYKVVPGKAFNRSFVVLPPYGNEYLKIILSVDDINLGVIAATHGARGSIRGGNNPLEMLLRDEYTDTETRGVNKSYDNMDAASTFDLSFKIEP